MHRAADRNVFRFRQGFLRAVTALRGLMRQISAENLVADRIPWVRFERVLEDAILPAMQETIRAGAKAAKAPLQDALHRRIVLKQVATETRIDLQLRNPRAEAWAAAEAADMVQRVTTETRLAIRSIVLEAQQRGLSIPQQARLIREHIGLTERQTLAVLHFSDRLVTEGFELGSEALEVQTRRYYNQLIRQRAQLIARTETIRAANRGQQALWEQSIAEGYLDLERKKVWIVTPDDRLCELCAEMDGATTPVTQPFNTPRGPVMSPDLHPGCRCAMAIAPEDT